MRGNGLCEGPGAAGPISLEGDPGAETNGPNAPGRLKAELLGGPIPAEAPARFILARLEPIFAIGSTCGTWVTENNWKREEEQMLETISYSYTLMTALSYSTAKI
jgi:hypothetical protein